jgi:hypothetical protein
VSLGRGTSSLNVVVFSSEQSPLKQAMCNDPFNFVCCV